MASTRGSGLSTVMYGTTAENVVSLKVVTPEGKLVQTRRRVRKSATGYDLTQLFVGSEGTLGVIVELTLKVQRVPKVTYCTCQARCTLTHARCFAGSLRCFYWIC